MTALSRFAPGSMPVPVTLQPGRRIDDPTTEIRVGAALVALFAIVGLGWSRIAPLDAAVVATGGIKVSGERQAVQNLAGGIVSSLPVKEGDHVRAGQLIVNFASTKLLAEERLLSARDIGLRAELARLDAQRRGAAAIVLPVSFATLTGADADEARRAIASESAELTARRAYRAAQNAVSNQRIVNDQISGIDQRLTANARQRAINSEELDALEGLLSKGYTTKTFVLALRRQDAALQGDTGAQTSEIARLRSAGGEARLQMAASRSDVANQNAERQRLAETELQSMLPQWYTARTALQRAQVRAPVDGTVVGLNIHTVDGVAAPGARLMDIVPDDPSLVLDVQLPTTDIGDVQVGQTAKAHLLAMRGHGNVSVPGTLTRLSADSLVDERSDRTYYSAEVRIVPLELARLNRDRTTAQALCPGAPVQLSITVRPRTALQYWFEPMMGWFSGALHEQ